MLRTSGLQPPGAMPPPAANSSRRGPGHPVSFPFPVTWVCLSKGVTTAIARRPVALRTRSVFTAPSPPPMLTSDLAPAVQPGPGVDSPTQWEMVVPKMARPSRIPAQTEPPKPDSVESPPLLATPTVPSLPAAPAKIQFAWQPAMIAGVMVGLIIAAGIWAVARPQRSSIAAPRPAAAALPPVPAVPAVPAIPAAAKAAEGSWVRARAPFFPNASTVQRSRQLLLYKASQDRSDYRLQFDWTPDAKGVGWVFRVSDTSNYYAAGIKLVQKGALRSLTWEHFAVIEGVESKHYRKTGISTGNNPAVRVSMEASGEVFMVSVQGERVVSWKDPRLLSGGLGFYEESGERPAVQSVQLSFSSPGPDFQGSFQSLMGSLR